MSACASVTTLTGTSGEIVSPGLSTGSGYPAGTDCSWVIRTADSKVSQTIQTSSAGPFVQIEIGGKIKTSRFHYLNVKFKVYILFKYSGTSPYGHLTSKKTSPLQSPWLSPKLYSTVQITPCNKVTSALRSLLPSPVGDLNSEVPL